MNEIKLSIIIPCYNHGEFIEECIASLNTLKNIEYEIILINDGSNDNGYTESVIGSLKHEKLIKINQPNQGLAKTRNNAIALSKGKYILPLDADNIITEKFIVEAIKIMDNNPNIDIVYPNRFLFNNKIKLGLKNPGNFSILRLLFSNYIDACAIYKKTIWVNLNGYDESMKLGLEDWDFWIRCVGINANFHYLKNAYFYYRVATNSMVTNTLKRYDEISDYIIKKNAKIYSEHLKKNAFEYSYRERKPILYYFRKLFTPKFFKK